MEEEYDLGTRLSIITIIMDESGSPRIDLGDCPPHVAYTIFHQAALILLDSLALPKITYSGEILFEEFAYQNDEDEGL